MQFHCKYLFICPSLSLKASSKIRTSNHGIIFILMSSLQVSLHFNLQSYSSQGTILTWWPLPARKSLNRVPSPAFQILYQDSNLHSLYSPLNSIPQMHKIFLSQSTYLITILTNDFLSIMLFFSVMLLETTEIPLRGISVAFLWMPVRSDFHSSRPLQHPKDWALFQALMKAPSLYPYSVTCWGCLQ